MNFRNISAWSIRNPVPSIVLFVFLTLAGMVSFMRMDVQQRSGHRFPGRHRPDRAARRRADRARDPGHPESRRRSACPGDRRDQLQHRRGHSQPGSSSPSAPRSTARSTRSAARSSRSAPTCPTASSSRRSAPRHRPTTTSPASPSPTDMRVEQLSWFIDNTISRTAPDTGPLRGRPHRRRLREIRVDPRSRQAPILRPHREPGEPAAPPGERQCCGRPRRISGPSSRPGPRQCRQRLSLAQTQIAIGGGRTVKSRFISPRSGLWRRLYGAAAADRDLGLAEAIGSRGHCRSTANRLLRAGDLGAAAGRVDVHHPELLVDLARGLMPSDCSLAGSEDDADPSRETPPVRSTAARPGTESSSLATVLSTNQLNCSRLIPVEMTAKLAISSPVVVAEKTCGSRMPSGRSALICWTALRISSSARSIGVPRLSWTQVALVPSTMLELISSIPWTERTAASTR